MPKPNFSYAKRQRELAKKQKKEEKRQRKTAERQGPQDDAVATTPAVEPKTE